MPSEVEAADGAEPSGFACALCGKSFARRDLRNRHRRRCEKSINKVRQSKKRSCEACGRSKLKCDLMQPACSRCQSRQIPCQYPNDAAAQAAQQNAERNSSISSMSTDMTFVSDDFLGDHFSMSSAPTTTMTGYHSPRPLGSFSDEQTSPFPSVSEFNMLDNMLIDSETYPRSETGFWDSNAGMALVTDENTFSDPMLSSTGFPLHFTPPGSGFGSPTRTDMHFLTNTEITFDQKLPFRPSTSTRQEDNFPGSMLGLETPPSSHSPMNSMIDTAGVFAQSQTIESAVGYLANLSSPMTRHGSALSSSPNAPASFFELPNDSLQSLPTPAPSRNGSIASLDQLGPKMRASTFRAFDTEEAASIICDYPQQMLDKSFSSPYIHPRYSHRSDSGLPEPIAVAMCCVSAKMTSADSSMPFVCKMIDSEREKLIKDLLKIPTPVDQTSAAIHALCIYQIESMLALRKAKPKHVVLSAEIHHRVLLKMARSVLRRNLSALQNRTSNDMDHQTWAAVESLRRNLFLLNMINDLSYATQALNQRFYEPVADEYLTNMPLPAPAAMWQAATPAQWIIARNETKWAERGIMTLGQAISRLNRGQDLGPLEPLQKMIVSCAWRRFTS